MYNITMYGQIEMNRGDSFKAPLFINCGDKANPIQYELTESDVIYFAVMEANQRFEDAIIKKIYNIHSDKDDNNNIIIGLSPEDTYNLYTGKYYYTVKIKHQTNSNQKCSNCKDWYYTEKNEFGDTVVINTEMFNDDAPYEVYTIIPETELWIMR